MLLRDGGSVDSMLTHESLTIGSILMEIGGSFRALESSRVHLLSNGMSSDPMPFWDAYDVEIPFLHS